ncbi:MAG: KTSC domain-containing protein [Phenylobacterium sp.]|uniref:KTSC domain-containing protein n=1 Tax=Phenylobacterium sp. TaxID=1871053 RepID=UPI00391B5660
MRLEADTITDISYDQGRAKLEVRFRDGAHLVHVGVPGEVHRSFIDAASKAGFYDDEIAGRYPYNLLEA